MATFLERRIAAAQLEGGLVQAGLSDHIDVAVRIASTEDPRTVRDALAAVCSAKVEAPSAEAAGETTDEAAGGRPAPINTVVLESLYENAPQATHAVAPAAAIEVSQGVRETLCAIKKLLPRDDAGKIIPTLSGWTLCVDPDGRPGAGVVLRFTTAKKFDRAPLDSTAHRFGEELGVPVRLEIGLLSESHAAKRPAKDPWAHDPHQVVAPGMSLSGVFSRPLTFSGSLTTPVRYLAGAVHDSETQDRLYPILTAAHPLAEGIKDGELCAVRQPAGNTNPDRVIGQVARIEYNRRYSSINLIDAAVAHVRQVATPEFGRRNKFRLAGIWTGEITRDTPAFIYGATSGSQRVRIEFPNDVTTTLLSLSATRLIYRDVMEFSNEENDTHPASKPGDSGAPLLIRSNDQYYLAGIVIGGGSRTADRRKPTSYAIPIGRVLLHFGLELL